MIQDLKKEEAKNSLICHFFPENISNKIFSTKWICKYMNEDIIKHLPSNSTPCFKFSIYKDELERRILGIPHISSYMILVNYISENIEPIYNKITNNTVSNSRSILTPYELIESFDETFKKRIWNSIGNKYILSLDISKCYENIYTHSISWALLGKDDAKKEFYKPEKKRNNFYKMADELDKKVRKINNDETKGIPTGPLTSRLISELILSEIDAILKKQFPDLKYNRFVDDYKFYFLKKEEAIQFIPQFQKILYEFKFSLNQSKTKIELFPNGIFTKDLKIELSDYDFQKNSIPSFIKKFMEFHNSGIKGAFKYGVKVLSSQEIPFDDRKYVLACLINSLIVFPMTSDIVIDIFSKNNLITDKNSIQITEILNNLLLENIKNDYDEEIFWNLYFLMKFDLEITLDNIERILKKIEPFTTIMTLDYIFHKGFYKKEKIKKELKDLKNRLKEKDIYSDEWLLLYECANNNWIRGLRKIVEKDYFLSSALMKNEKFYYSLFDKK